MIYVTLVSGKLTKIGQKYDVIRDGMTIVSGSYDPEPDAARALLRGGLTGKFTVLSQLGSPRSVWDIGKLARLTSEDNGFRRHRERAASAPSGGLNEEEVPTETGEELK